MKKLILATVLLLVMACGDDEPVDELFIPNISNQWESNRNSFFFFAAENNGVNESDFTGNEQKEGDNFEFTGHFKNYDIEFTFSDGTEVGIQYKGKIVKGSDPLKIKATGTNGQQVELMQKL